LRKAIDGDVPLCHGGERAVAVEAVPESPSANRLSPGGAAS
jgi:hypothetical protein